MSYPIGRSVRCCNMVCPIILILSYESASLILSTFSIGNEFFVLFTIKFILCLPCVCLTSLSKIGNAPVSPNKFVSALTFRYFCLGIMKKEQNKKNRARRWLPACMRGTPRITGCCRGGVLPMRIVFGFRRLFCSRHGWCRASSITIDSYPDFPMCDLWLPPMTTR